MVKKILLIVVGLLLVLTGFYLKDKQYYDAFPYIVPSFFAKEYCSCRYVMNRDGAFCESHATLVLPVSSFDDNPQSKEVSASGLGVTATAKWVSQRNGCELQ